MILVRINEKGHLKIKPLVQGQHAADSGQVTLVVFLDLSVAFDTLDQRLEMSFGVGK